MLTSIGRAVVRLQQCLCVLCYIGSGFRNDLAITFTRFATQSMQSIRTIHIQRIDMVVIPLRTKFDMSASNDPLITASKMQTTKRSTFAHLVFQNIQKYSPKKSCYSSKIFLSSVSVPKSRWRQWGVCLHKHRAYGCNTSKYYNLVNSGPYTSCSTCGSHGSEHPYCPVRHETLQSEGSSDTVVVHTYRNMLRHCQKKINS